MSIIFGGYSYVVPSEGASTIKARGSAGRDDDHVTTTNLLKSHNVQQVAAALVQPDQRVPIEQTLADLACRGLRQGTAQELVAFALAFPNEERTTLLLAFGSARPVDGGSRLVPCMRTNAAHRVLYLHPCGRAWSGSETLLVILP
jgi:hypothetical protein